MELEYFGGNCVIISTKKARLVIDDDLAKLGLKSVIKAGDIALYSSEHEDPKVETKLIIDTPGEYEVSDISVQGIASRAHNEEAGKRSTVIYKVIAGDIKLAIVGNIYPDLNDNQLESIGTVDILVLPVGGNDYTLNSQEALRVIKKIEPKIIVPTHYSDKQIKYEVEQQSLEEAIKDLALEAKPASDSLKLKPNDLSDITQLVVLKRS
jgi:L-ascorbate metabolism protein UlaG (beta-lactamase superfamily)